MSPKCFLLLLSVSFAVEIVSESTTAVFPSSIIQTNGYIMPSAATPAVTSTVTHTPPLSSVNIASTVSLKPHDSVTSAVQPSSTSFPVSSSAFTVLTVTQSTKQPTTSDLSAKGKTIGGMEMMGFAILTVLGIMVTTFAVYYFFYRERMYPEYVNPLKVYENGQAPGEVGITHKAFVGDAESQVAAPEPEVKVVIGPEVTSQVKGNEGPVDSAL